MTPSYLEVFVAPSPSGKAWDTNFFLPLLINLHLENQAGWHLMRFQFSGPCGIWRHHCIFMRHLSPCSSMLQGASFKGAQHD